MALRTSPFLLALACGLAAGLVATGGAGAAEPLERVPGSLDPLLRATPIEPERIRPPPAPELSAPAVPGTQTVILRDRVAHPRNPGEASLEPLPPVVLHVPAKYFHRTSSRPVETWELFLLLTYPSLDPDPGAEGRCGKPWCGDELFINLINSRWPTAHSRIEGLETDVAHKGDEYTSYETVTPPPGYDAAYIRSYPKDPTGPRREEFLVIRGGQDARETLGECSLDTPVRLCDFYVDAPGSTVRVHYATRMINLPERPSIENAVLGMVRDFLAPDRAATPGQDGK